MIIIYCLDEDLFKACGGKRLGMRARMPQEGKWKRIEEAEKKMKNKDENEIKEGEKEPKKRKHKHHHDKKEKKKAKKE